MSRLLGRPLAALTLVAVLGLAGCTGQSPTPGPIETTEPSASVVDTPSSAPTAAATPTLVAGGTAAENLPFFTQVVRGVWSGPNQVAGRAYIDALAAAGFDKAAMQVTADQTTVDNPAESIEFSVRLGDQCLVGQVGPSIGNPVTAVLPGLSSGGCLIGQTRAIDW
ncbi:hypothetical protein QE418_003354 [Microbacterium testaceum]|uniref:DUF6993 domain-containing protein n=1 Tax=Microbacterium TaxID=33882 RepID=UPI00278B0551|nr:MULTISPECIES: hypothetical protein [Microbacterium]MDQ1113906.1 hypothetical protein [Microbacterium testaceum]MDR6098987.1 hypothetical protein [Microbacterium sp. SORGH_AS_0454]